MSNGKKCPHYGEWKEDCYATEKWVKQDRAMLEVYCKVYPDYARCPRFIEAERRKMESEN